MPHLKYCSDEPEQSPPAPLPFVCEERSWRTAGSEMDGEPPMDSIKQAEAALERMQAGLDEINELTDEYFEPIPMSRWRNDDDDGPWAA